jgi:branched-chain amino acid transport system permease protein
VAFTVSAGLAGLAGCLLASVQITVTGDSFIPEASVFILVYAVVGGITTPTGAVIAGFIAGASGQVLQLFIGNAGSWQLVLFGVMAVQMTIMYPAGYGGMLPRELPGLRWLSARWHARGRAGPNEAVLPTAGGTS